MSAPDPTTWAKLGPLYVTQAAAEQAAASGQAVRIYPEGMEALGEYISLPGQLGNKPRRANASMMAKRLTDIGTYPMSGVIDMDSNPGLTPDVWRGYGSQVGIVDQMRMEDPVVAAIVYAMTAPIIRSHWKVEPGGDDRQALEEAEFIRANLFEYLQGGFYKFVEQAVSAVWRGFSLFEIVARFDRDSKQTRLDQLSTMLPNTVYSWNRYESGRWGVTQEPYQGDSDVGGQIPEGGASLPPEKLLHIVWNQSGDNPEGMSVLRPCYAGWKSRRLMLKLEATGFERGAFGIPYVEVDPTARTGDSATVNEILRELRTGARAWAAFPPGYTLKFADFPFKGADLREARIAAGQDMARAAMAPFLFTGERAGSYSLIAGQLDFFTMNLQTAADMIGAALSHGSDSLIQRLCRWNYSRTSGFPKLVPGSMSLGSPKELVEAIKLASESGALLPDRGVEEAVRAALGLPEMPEHESREEMEHRLINARPAEVKTEVEQIERTEVKSKAPAVTEVTDDQAEETEREAKEMESLAEGLRRPMAVSGRELRAEERFVRLDETLAPMVGVKEAMAQAAEDWREAMAPKYAERMSRAGDLLKMRSVDVPDLGKLGEAFRVELRRAYRAGQGSVREEIDRMASEPEFARAVEGGDYETTRDGIVVESPEEVAVLQEVSMKVPSGVRNEMKRGLKWHEQGLSGDGLTAATVSWARRIVSGEPITKDKAIKMRAWLKRHEVDKQGEGFRPGEKGFPSPGRVAWALWGGDPAVPFSNRLVSQLEREELSDSPTQCQFSFTGQNLTGIRYLLNLSEDSRLLLAPTKRARKVKAGKPDAPGNSVADEIDPEEAIENVARTSALAAGDRVKTASITAIQSAAIGGVLPAEAVAETVVAAVTSLSPGADLVAGQRDTNTIFGLGRMQEARAQGVEEGIRSAMLESATCDVCLSKDGARFAMEELDEYATPDPDCLGGDQCNCIVIFIPKE
tara:strand:+ start:456 stop:3371 length:2916 start_codon:yes stop_codon:yes gene_type:complete